MDDIAIRATGLSKEYRIGQKRTPYRTFRETLADTLGSPFRRLFTPHSLSRRNEAETPGPLTPQSAIRNPHSDRTPQSDTIWALKNVSFEIKRGEVVGIIGRNGAGKSTLLKVLSRVTEPTEGQAEIHGRVGSLLEVGTGFHPELSGRENIFLNGSIIGMKRAEIAAKFDEMVAFAEVEKFIDTPVKHYSSGMYLRLAFAVAAHLETEILLVDEVLAVGDSEFQRKCLGKMGSVAEQGRTVLFVSHNMAAMHALCRYGILLRQGRVAMQGDFAETAREYCRYLMATAKDAFRNNPERSGDGSVRLTGGRVLDEMLQPASHLIAGKPATFEFAYQNKTGARRIEVLLTIFNHLGIPVTHCSTKLAGRTINGVPDEGMIACQVANLPLPIGDYRIAVAVESDGKTTDLMPNALTFSVASSVFYPSGKMPSINYCSCMVAHEWQHGAGIWAAPKPSN